MRLENERTKSGNLAGAQDGLLDNGRAHEGRHIGFG